MPLLSTQVVVHGFMESDSYSPLLNISVIPQVTYRLVKITYVEKLAKKPISYTLFSVTFCLLGTSHLEENVQL